MTRWRVIPSAPHFPAGDRLEIPIDPNGNLAQKTEGTDTWTYSWNAENQLTRVEENGADVARLAYDPMGRRVEKVAGEATTTYAYAEADVLREVRGTSTLKYVSGPAIDHPLAIDGGTAVAHLDADGLGSIVKETDAPGAVTLTRVYDAWGNLEVGADEPGYAFTGREWDPQTGLYYYRARYYDPTIGRFLSEDPSGLGGGDVNFYAYVWNNPARYLDPFGLEVVNLSDKPVIVKPETGPPGTVPGNSTYPGKIDGVMGPDGKWVKFPGKEWWWVPDNSAEVTKDGQVGCVGGLCKLFPPKKLPQDPDAGWHVPKDPKQLPGCKSNK